MIIYVANHIISCLSTHVEHFSLNTQLVVDSLPIYFSKNSHPVVQAARFEVKKSHFPFSTPFPLSILSPVFTPSLLFAPFLFSALYYASYPSKKTCYLTLCFKPWTRFRSYAKQQRFSTVHVDLYWSETRPWLSLMQKIGMVSTGL